MILNFEIENTGEISKLLISKGIKDFNTACDYIMNLSYKRISNTSKIELVIIEERGTCSTKHSVLATLALENNHPEIEIIMGIFLMNSETHPILKDFFKDKHYKFIPEAHCYLRFKGERYDFTSSENRINEISQKIVREQRIDPHQIGEWKIAIHKDYLKKWLNRQVNLDINLEQLWDDREKCIKIIEKQSK